MALRWERSCEFTGVTSFKRTGGSPRPTCELLPFRSKTGRLSEARYGFGYALNPDHGLVMVGGRGLDDTFATESTTDGINMTSSAVASIRKEVYFSCMVSVGNTLISFGGRSTGRRISVLKIGDTEWKVSSRKIPSLQPVQSLTLAKLHFGLFFMQVAWSPCL